MTTKNPPSHKHPEWSDAEIVKVRQMARKGHSATEVKEALGSPLQAHAIQARAKKYGITFARKRSAHEGTSALTMGGHGTTPRDLTIA